MSFGGELHTFDLFDLLGWLASRKRAGNACTERKIACQFVTSERYVNTSSKWLDFSSKLRN